jgi:hypothetical protein
LQRFIARWPAFCASDADFAVIAAAESNRRVAHVALLGGTRKG